MSIPMGTGYLIVGGLLFAVFGILVGFFSGQADKWHKQRMARYEVLRQALQHPGLDAQLRHRILQILAEEGGFGRHMVFRALSFAWFAAGWCMLLGGFGVCALLKANLISYMPPEGPIAVGCMGFVLLTLPLAWREWNERRTSLSPR
jgi:hypothetical protein